VSSYRIVGTKGDLRLEPAYAYTSDLIHYLTVNGTTRRKTYVKRDQFAAELAYFSQCVQNGEQPETSGIEGLADVRIIEAINRSAKENAPCAIEPIQKSQRPTLRQENHKPAVPKPELVKTESPTIK
jgi:predicted dehydrogenase